MTLSENEKATHYIEIWKQTVAVQQHFNDIEWRIRGLALTVVTFALGAAAVAARDGQSYAGAALLLVGLLLWYAFYFVDRYWYHPLLKASVDQGHKLEDQLTTILPDVNLTKMISAGSSISRPRVVRLLTLGHNRNAEMHSIDKLIWFYRLGAAALLASAIALGALALLSQPASNEPTVVRFDPDATPSAEPRTGKPTPAGLIGGLLGHPPPFPGHS